VISSLGSIFLATFLATSAVNAEPSQKSFGYLWDQTSNADGKVEKTARPYTPREGDILLFDDMSPFWTKLYKIAGTAPPFHAGIVFKKTDGSFAVLESGPDDTLHVFLLDIEPRLYDFKGSIQVRQAKRALTKDESETLTNFAYAQEGKRYAMWRLLLQGTYFMLMHRKASAMRCGDFYCKVLISDTAVASRKNTLQPLMTIAPVGYALKS